MRFTPEQLRCIEFSESVPQSHQPANLVIEAGAGAGKTAVLAQRVVWKIASAPQHERADPHEMVLVTFTKAAEKELAHRVADLLSAQAPKATGAVHISTIDSLLMSLFEAHFPGFWHHTFQGPSPFPEDLSKSVRSAPQVRLIDEDQALAELDLEFAELFQNFSETMDPVPLGAICDFVLAGGLSAPWGNGNYTKDAFGSNGRQEVLKFLMSESCLLLAGRPLELLQQTVHPGAAVLFERLVAFGRRCALKRLYRGRITHTDRLVFLHNLYCAPTEVRKGTPYGGIDIGNLLTAKEIIVDEYQDTNPAQHELLVSLAQRQNARMIVVGDPKQSLYRFRQAKVEVFKTLTQRPEWCHIVLADNFRSDPLLLNELNALARLALSFQNTKIPEGFWESDHGKAALSCRVGPLDLRAGRSLDQEESPSEGTESQEPTSESQQVATRVFVLTHSIATGRIPTELEQELKAHNIRYPDLSEQLILEAIHKLTTGGFALSDIAILCETNRDCDRVREILKCAGVPCSRTSKNPRQGTSNHALRAGIALLECLRIAARGGSNTHTDLSCLELFELLSSPLFKLSLTEAACQAHILSRQLAEETSNPSAISQELSPELWHQLVTLGRANIFAAWHCLVNLLLEHEAPEDFLSSPKSFTAALKSWTLEFSRAFEEQGLRSALQAGPSMRRAVPLLNILPGHLLRTTSAEPSETLADSDPGAQGVVITTVHAAKGLQWKGVVFLPKTIDRQPNPTFRCLPLGDRNVIEWLKEPGDLEIYSRIHVTDRRDPSERLVWEPLLNLGNETSPEPLRDLKFQEQAESEFERARVFYTAITRAEERLVLLNGLGSAGRKKSLRDDFEGIVDGDLPDKLHARFDGLVPWTLASYLDGLFDLRFRRPEGKRAKALPAEPWLHSEKAPFRPEWQKGERPVEYWDFSSPSLPRRLAAVLKRSQARAKKPQKSHTLGDREGNDHHVGGSKDTGASHPGALADVPLADVVSATWALVQTGPKTALSPKEPRGPEDAREAEECSAPAETPESRSRIDKIQEGLLFHAEQELGHERLSGTVDELAALENASLRVFREFEIWTLDTDMPLSRSSQLASPQRHIIDLLCFCRLSDLPPAFAAAAGSLVITQETEGQLSLLPWKPTPEPKTPSDPMVAIVIDYKTGTADPSHHAQLFRYLDAVARVHVSAPSISGIPDLIQDPSQASDPLALRPLMMGCIAYMGPRVSPERRRQVSLAFLETAPLPRP